MIPQLAFGMPAAPEWIVIGILALVLFGPKKIPEIARGLGKALGELQRAKEDFQREITGVPPLPKIESPTGVQSTASAGITPVESGVTSSMPIPAQQSNPPGTGETKA
jgi:sec-independent protein translocase protein TatA